MDQAQSIPLDHKYPFGHMITGRQIAAARALLGMKQDALAARSRVSVPTIKRMEASDGEVTGYPNNVLAVKAALEDAGIEFIAENGGGPGVRLRRK